MHKKHKDRSFEEFILIKYGKTWKELKEYRRCKPTKKSLGLLTIFLFSIVAYAIVFWGMHF